MQPSDPVPPRSAPPQTSPHATRPVPPPAPDLSLNKVLAAAGAAATSAVLGSLFGVAGTVLGAAVGAVASTVAASLYQRSLERARRAVVSHVPPQVSARLRRGEKRPTADGPDPEATVTMPPAALVEDPRTVLIAPQVPGRSRRRVVAYVVAAVLGFALALGAVTGAEAIKGSTLVTGQAGTSVGRVLTGDRETATPTPTPDDSDDGDSNDSRNSDNQGDNDHHRNNTDSGSASPSATRSTSPSSSRSAAPTTSPTAAPTTSAGPSRSGDGLLGGLGAASGRGNQ